MFTAECPALPGCISQGKTRKEAERNIKDAAKGYIESLKKHNEPIPPPIEEDIVDLGEPCERTLCGLQSAVEFHSQKGEPEVNYFYNTE